MNAIKKSYCIIAFLLISICTFSQNFRVESTINSIGYYIENATNISNKVSYEIKFKETLATNWRQGLDPSTFNYLGGNKLFAGSILQLKANTNYTLEVKIIDSIPNIHTFTFSSNITTRAEPNINIPTADTLWVKNNGAGHLYSKQMPGAFDTLFNNDFNKIRCGTTILCSGGTYNVGELNLNINNLVTPCSNENNPIIITSATNETAIFDGSDIAQTTLYPTWTIYDAAQKIYKTTLPNTDAYSALMLYDTVRLFPYATVYPVSVLFGTMTFRECLSSVAFGSGFYRNGSNYYIKLANGENPNNIKITVSKFNYFLNISKASINYNPKFIIKNITVKNYGKSVVTFNPIFGNLETETEAVALTFRDIKNSVIDNCKFYYNTMSVVFWGSSDSTILQNNTIKDQTGTWMHGAYKNSALVHTGSIDLINDNGKYGRSLEKSFVFFETKNNTEVKNIIIRKNTIDGLVSGISGRQKETTPFQDVDVNDNIFLNCYDAIDIIGNVANYRVWNNRITTSLVPFSFIPFTENGVVYGNTGPAYVFRNIADKISSRKNLTDVQGQFPPPLLYINYGGCEGVQAKTWGSALKMETGAYPTNPRMDLHFYHNTISSDDTLGYNFYLWKGTWRKIICKNNSFNSQFNNVNFEDINNITNYPFISINDNYFSNHNKLGTVNKIHNTPSTCATYNNLDSLDKYLRLATGNIDTNFLKIKGLNFIPNFVDANNGDFHLNNSSPLIDKGVSIANINDVANDNYFGNFPDIGALENNSVVNTNPNVPTNNNIFKVFPNPNFGNLNIVANKNIKQVLVYNNDGKLIYTTTISIPATSIIIKLKPYSRAVFLLKVIYIDNSFATTKLVL